MHTGIHIFCFNFPLRQQVFTTVREQHCCFCHESMLLLHSFIQYGAAFPQQMIGPSCNFTHTFITHKGNQLVFIT